MARSPGLPALLVERALRPSTARVYDRVWLDSSRRFGRAHRLYERNGFTRVASLDNDWEDDIYEKIIALQSPG